MFDGLYIEWKDLDINTFSLFVEYTSKYVSFIVLQSINKL